MTDGTSNAPLDSIEAALEAVKRAIDDGLRKVREQQARRESPDA